MEIKQFMTQPLTTFSLNWLARSALLAGVCILFAGCNSGEQVYQLSGTITYKGKPVPSGMIIFEPDSGQGNSGAPGRSKIEDGKYDTASQEGHGIVGGPHVIRIIGMDGGNKGSSSSEVGLPNMLFPEYNAKVDLPKEDGVKDFEIPAKR